MDKATKWSSDELEGLRVSEAIRQGVLTERNELRAENEQLRAERQGWADTFAQNMAVIGAENERLRAALKEYADFENWVGATGPMGGELSGWCGAGKGWETAQAALARDKCR
jgi:hypothetical protein